MTAYNVTIAPKVRKKIEKALKGNPTKKEKVNNALEVLKTHGPEYPVYFFDNYVNNAGYRCTPGNTMQLTFQGSQ